MRIAFICLTLGFVMFLYCLLFLGLQHMPFLDLPSHLARSNIILHLLGDGRFSNSFSVDFAFRPYIAGDLFLALFIRLFGVDLAAKIWMTLCFVIIPVALALYMRTLSLSREKIAIGTLLAIYISTDWFFLSAYSHYRLGIGSAFLTLSALEIFTKTQSGSRLVSYIPFCVATLLTYSLHFASFFFLAMIIGTSIVAKLLWNRLTWSRAIATLLPCFFLVSFHVFINGAHSDYFARWGIRTFSEKLTAVGTMFIRFNFKVDLALFAALIFIILSLSIRRLIEVRMVMGDAQARQLCLTVVILAILFGILPVSVSTLYDVDGRALPFLFLFTIIFSLKLYQQISLKPSHYIIVATMVALVNYLYIATYLRTEDHFLAGYHEALMNVPENNRVLPVSTRPPRGRIDSALHFGALYTIERGGVTPYISSSRLGEPFSYFHYKDNFYAPIIFWYTRNRSVDWPQVQSFFDYLVVTKPYDLSQLKLEGLSREFSNSAATVFRITRVNEGITDLNSSSSS